MSDGLITRIGKWIDSKFEDKATVAQIDELRHHAAILSSTIAQMDFTELKTRLEKVELYCGMTRKVDPTKPAVAKSAFSM